MKNRKSAPAPEGEALKRRDVLRLSAALAAFGAAMGIAPGTSQAIEYKKQDSTANSKSIPKDKSGTTTKNQIAIKKNDGSQKFLKWDDKPGSK